MDAATITPTANPESAFLTLTFNSFFKKNTQAAPAVVPTNGIRRPVIIVLMFLPFLYQALSC